MRLKDYRLLTCLFGVQMNFETLVFGVTRNCRLKFKHFPALLFHPAAIVD